MEKLREIGFSLLCAEDEVVWQLQHGAFADVAFANIERKRALGDLARWLRKNMSKVAVDILTA